MTDADGTWLNADPTTGLPAFDATELRRADAALLAGSAAFEVHAGIVPHGDPTTVLKTSVDGSDVATVTPGAVVLPGNFEAGQGPYRAGFGGAPSAAHTQTLTPRDATNARMDLVVARMLDSDVATAHGAKTARIEIIPGTPSATPGVPALPSMAVELDRITVPAVGGGAATVNGAFRRYCTALGGLLLAGSAARLPATAMPYQRARLLDTGEERYFDGSVWTTDDTGWVSPGATGRFSQDATEPVELCRIGKRVQMTGRINNHASIILPANNDLVDVWTIGAQFRPNKVLTVKPQPVDGNTHLRMVVWPSGSVQIANNGTKDLGVGLAVYINETWLAAS